MKTKSEATRVHAVIPAAGRGVRFGNAQNKVFEDLEGRTVIERTVDAFRGIADKITVVASADEVGRLVNLVAGDGVFVETGGSTRQESVLNGLKTVADGDTIVVVHDGARPLISRELINRCIDSAVVHGSGVAAVKIVDALKRADESVMQSPIVVDDEDRAGVWAAQTPQAFTAHLLNSAHAQAGLELFVGPDEASLVQRLPGVKVHLVDGDRSNIKITTPDDLSFARRLSWQPHYPETRIGIGYDIHRLVDGRPLWLGGVQIHSSLGLDGHSDADVLLHAICDSLLGAAGLPDIGHYFPNTDPQYCGISSLVLLSSVYEILRKAGWMVGNVDTMLIAEKPRIAPFIDQMKEHISSALHVASDRVSVKATTNEGIGSLGAAQGIACHASATIFRGR